MKNISVLGSTGSIGVQTLDVVRKNKDKFNIVGLSANSNADLLYEQIVEFRPQKAAIFDDACVNKLRERLNNINLKTEITSGMEGLIEVATIDDAHMVLVAVVGMVGLQPTVKAIEKSKDIALANKETLVAGGRVVMEALKNSRSKLIPVDSEHSAIFQCLQLSSNPKDVEKIILTASGGPFRGKKTEDLVDISPEKALKHPNWSMGRKISIDSATLMNKGLEVIEAHWLFDRNFDKIDVVVHPQSIIHSMVEYIDGSIIAQLGAADMRNPILYALSYPERLPGVSHKLNLVEAGKLTFEEPDYETFKCLKLSYDAGKIGGTMPVVLNAANEAAVDLFSKGKIKFLDIQDIVEQSMLKHNTNEKPSIEEIIEIDKNTKSFIYKNYLK
ncbi:1-deoxy-D-xylulose 5-phosphate reductoisomerase [Oxobacter pfennigii]|uniref:1-deoxy-D-xylulose 5-phosphate reductoisomerase n=1 Tax=Oxobacter pfennigii TaxID=36849 RepID=A0A0P8WN09_9CLOT|nr:1-deoxy-D-xylulose-5-phosphate reductoisomerase [Oxobacter pfennigii]KPU43911.1 1-deoxy-D-xylulose 5-phosphate reductoisomerase [Oxobacter pfennigii]